MIDWTYKATPGDIIMGNKPSKRVYPSDIIFGISKNPKVPTVEKEAEKNTGANRSAVGSLGQSSGIGAAGNAQAGLVGSVNTEVQNDDQLLPYTKI
tara:strand:- start:618 stop:905 length:288 start_codon:yes stop_codon:yes gene_type:complete